MELRFMNEGRKGMRNNEEGVGRGNETRFLRLVKVDWWSDVSHINVCEGIRVKITKDVRERDENGWEGRREGREFGELGEDSIW